MSETRTMTAAEAAKDAELWERVRRGECVIRDIQGGLVLKTANVRTASCGLGFTVPSGDMRGWCWTMAGNWDVVIPADEVFTIIPLSAEQQDAHCPAAVERLQTRITELEAENARLYALAYGYAKPPSAAPVAPASASDAMRGDEDKATAENGAQIASQLDDGYWADED